jgi:hypothetical protein
MTERFKEEIVKILKFANTTFWRKCRRRRIAARAVELAAAFNARLDSIQKHVTD